MPAGFCSAAARSFEQSSGTADACGHSDRHAEHTPNADTHTTSTARCAPSVLPTGTRDTRIQLGNTHAGALFDSSVCLCCVQGRSATTVTSWSNQTPTALPSVPRQPVPAADPQVHTPTELTLRHRLHTPHEQYLIRRIFGSRFDRRLSKHTCVFVCVFLSVLRPSPHLQSSAFSLQ